MSIGAVLARLRPDFPDVTISKIRFLESEGLVSPGRTESGYRQFTDADLARLRYILAAQRDHYLPLKVIKEQLDAAGDGAVPELDRPGVPKPPRPLVSVGAPPSAEDFAADSGNRCTLEQLLEGAGIDRAMLGELEQYGLVRRGAAGFFDEEAVIVARTARQMTEYGIEPRHLRAFRASADREVGLLEQIVAPLHRQRDPESRARAEEVVRELAALSVSLHTLLVKAGIREVGGS